MQAPPPYTRSAKAYPSAPNASGGKGLTALPLHLIHRILSLTLDPRATPSRFYADPDEERVRRVWALFRGLRGVNRVFWLVATSILRANYLESYLHHVQRGYSSDPYPYDDIAQDNSNSTCQNDSDGSVYAKRGRETAVFDKFIAVRVGMELRRSESELSEEGEAERDIFTRLQPAARMEDLLLSLPDELISRNSATGYTLRTIPLSHRNLSINLTPGWVQLNLHPIPIIAGKTGGGNKELVIQVKRTSTLEGNLVFLQQGLDSLRRGLVGWGEKVG